jgi:hypothetical protein
MMREAYDGVSVLTGLPSGMDTGWRFGGYAYGLEPLTIPYPGSADIPEDRPRSAEFSDACKLITMMSAVGPLTTDVEPFEDEDTLYWFRWITGHQATFVIWRLTAQLLYDIENRRRAAGSAIPALSQYVDAYNAMLLYTGSCVGASYHRVIRPSMRMRHPGFSGTWAPDYTPIRLLLRGMLAPIDRGPDSDSLTRAIRLNKVVHEHVAAKLVPDGVSLLRSSVVAARRQERRLLNLIYDNYFLTLRGPASRSDMVAQLLRRLLAIVQDIEVNGLTPDREPDGELPDELRHYEQNMSQILAATARRAAGIPDDSAAVRRSRAAALTASRTR